MVLITIDNKPFECDTNVSKGDVQRISIEGATLIITLKDVTAILSETVAKLGDYIIISSRQSSVPQSSILGLHNRVDIDLSVYPSNIIIIVFKDGTLELKST